MTPSSASWLTALYDQSSGVTSEKALLAMTNEEVVSMSAARAAPRGKRFMKIPFRMKILRLH